MSFGSFSSSSRNKKVSSSSSKKPIENRQARYHIRDYNFDEYVFVSIFIDIIENLNVLFKVTEEDLAPISRDVAALMTTCNKHLGLIFYPMKYTFNKEGCKMTRISSLSTDI